MSSSNSRKFFRVSDKVALTVNPIDTRTHNITELFERRRKEVGLANRFVQEKEKKRPSLLSIERRFPDVALYIEYLENKIQLLANQTGTDDQNLKMSPTHHVDLSASGINFSYANRFAENSLVEISIRLFPSRIRIHTISTVIRCVASKNHNQFAIAAKFTHIHEEDEELLFRHIHAVQNDALKVIVN